MAQGININTFNAMQTGEPYKSYIKTILAKLYVTVWNPWEGKAEGLIIQGDPKGNRNDVIVDVWSETEDLFFKRSNRVHLEKGYIVEYKRKPQDVPEKSPNELSDEELEEMLKLRFLSLQKKVNEMTSVAPVFRLLEIAQEKELSTKIVQFLEGKVSELQQAEYVVPEVEE